MIDITFDESRQLVRLTFADTVTAAAARSAVETLRSLLAHVRFGFQLLADLSLLQMMEVPSAAHVEEAMDILREKGVKAVARVIPDPRKDIGFTIMAIFRYEPGLPVATFKTLDEALEYLSA